MEIIEKIRQNIPGLNNMMIALDETMSIKEIIETQQEDIFKFSRIPTYNGSIEDVTGIVLTKRIFKQTLEDDTVTVNSIKNKMFSINENVPVSKALDLFISKSKIKCI